MPLDIVLQTISKNRVEVEHGTSLEAGALPSRGSTHQDVGKQNQEAISLVGVPFLESNFVKAKRDGVSQDKATYNFCDHVVTDEPAIWGQQLQWLRKRGRGKKRGARKGRGGEEPERRRGNREGEVEKEVSYCISPWAGISMGGV